MTLSRLRERVIEGWILFSGLACSIFVVLIFAFLVREAFPLFQRYSVGEFLFGLKWYPISHPPSFGTVTLFVGTLWVTLGAALISLPLGLACAVFIAEIAPKRVRDILKVSVELLAAIPSVVLGFVGLVTLVPWVRRTFGLPTGLTAFTGSLVLAFMAMPTIVTILDDAIRAVPRSYREGALALGASRWQMIRRVVLVGARSGILAGMMLGIGRVIGETMAVMMITGNAAALATSLFQPVRTMTATIAAEMGEAVRGSLHYHALFGIGLVLFLITFVINLTADRLLHRGRVR